MNFAPTETQTLIARTARDFAERELMPRAKERDEKSIFPEAELRALGKLGLLGVNVPEEFGGSEAGVFAYSMAMQEIARGDASVSVAMSVTNMVSEVICEFGTTAQKQKYVTRLTAGDAVAGAFALSEPQAGSDPAGMRTTAKKTASGYRLNGAKQWITSGDHAGVIIVWAKTDAAAGNKGISAFIVEKGTRGLRAGRHEDKMGLRGSTTVPLAFEDCDIPADALLGHEGQGLSVALAALDGGRIGIASQAIGIADAALGYTTRYIKERQQFGKPLAAFQALQFRVADVATELAAARLLTYRVCGLKERGVRFSKEAAMAKLYASESAGRACDAAVQLHGGYGYTREYPVERLMRDVRVTRIYEGTSEIQRLVISRALLSHTA